jgi:hypothetical protein
MALETNEKQYLRNSFLVGAALFAIPLVYGAIREFPKEFYIFTVPPLAGLLVIVYALENSVRHLRRRIELLEDEVKHGAPPASPARTPEAGERRP